MKYEELYPNCHSKLRGTDVACGRHPNECSQLPGTILRVFIPAGAVINFLNLIEFASPSGICFIIRLPFLGGSLTGTQDLASIFNTIRSAGGSVEVVKE